MRLQKIRLHDWQSYYGHGKNATELALFGKNDLKNAIVYGQNTRGKTALWEAIRFALYGRVVRRVSTSTTRLYKPVFAVDSAREPLLSVAAAREGHFAVGVELWFDQRGETYHLDRKFQVRAGIAKPKGDTDFEMTVILRNESTSKFVTDPDVFLQEHLPEDLVPFFMFDGERLEEYRLLLQDQNDVELRGYIENILRLPVLTHGIEDFQDINRLVNKRVRRFEMELSKDKKLLQDIASLEAGIDALEDVIVDDDAKAQRLDSQIAEVEGWLQEHDQGKVALAQEEQFQKDEERLESEIESEEKRIKATLPDVWRTLLTPKIDAAVESIKLEIDRQRGDQTKQFAIRQSIERLGRELDGDPCGECGISRDEIKPKRKEEIHSSIAAFDKEIADLEISRGSPDPHQLEERLRSLLLMRREQSLDPLVTAECELLKKKKSLRDTVAKKDKAAKQLTAAARREVAEKLLERKGLEKKLGVQQALTKKTKDDLKEERSKLHQASAGLKTEGVKSVEHVRAEKAGEMLTALADVWKSSLAAYRKVMLKRVETAASTAFMDCSNNASNYSGLRISPQFTISILDLQGEPDLASPGQWAIVAYAMLEALTDCSGIEFPMVVDTPGRSIDNDHLSNVFERFLNNTRQVVFLPQGSELDPKEGDKKYGHRCAATYLLTKDSQDRTKVHLRVDNLIT
jgi:DNA sulfur modification protein DndD